jgi:hypothetical protein
MSEVVKIASSWPNEGNRSSVDETVLLPGTPSADFKPRFRAEFLGKILAFSVEEPNLFVCLPEGHRPRAGLRAPHDVYTNVAELKPSNLRDFEFVWDKLSGGSLPADSITKVALSGTVAPPGRAEGNDREAPVRIRADLPSPGLDEPNSVQLYPAYADCNDADPGHPKGFVLQGDLGRLRFHFEVVALRRTLLSQRADREKLSVAPVDEVRFYRGYPFVESFPDLSRATIGRSEEDIDTLAHQIFAEASKSAEAFEALGIKFPAEQVTRWGMVILISVQLYLFMYLRRLSNKLRPDDAGWDAPWIAMDPSLMARLILFITIVLLPIGVAVLLAAQPFFDDFDPRFGWRYFAAERLRSMGPFRTIPVLVVLFASLQLAFRSWAYRPKPKETLKPGGAGPAVP